MALDGQCPSCRAESRSDRGRSRAARHDDGASEGTGPSHCPHRSGRCRAEDIEAEDIEAEDIEAEDIEPRAVPGSCGSAYVIITEQRMLSIGNRPLRIR
jgi:hypothetical protein